MLILNDIHYLYKNRDKYRYAEYLREALKHIHELQYQSGEFITEYCQDLRRQLQEYAQKHSPVYKHLPHVSKADLLDKKKWYVQGWKGAASTTGGSTTNQKFHYLRWADTYLDIEGDIHYKAILHEYKLDRPIKILYCMMDQFEDRNHDNLVRTYTTPNVLISHGMRTSAAIHDLVMSRLYMNDYFGFYEKLINYLTDTEIDVILAPGSFISELTWNIKRLHHTAPICKLLSSTGTKTQRQDVDFLKESGIVENWCDHMRCWDGGVTFFTCPYHTYHLLDGMAWATSPDGKLTSDDFYSLPSPFVNYWNGDYASIGSEYKKCKCGRSYREFSIDRTRNVAINGMNNKDVAQALMPLSELFPAIKRVNQIETFIRFFTHSPLASGDRQRIRQALPSFEINFVTESLDG